MAINILIQVPRDLLIEMSKAASAVGLAAAGSVHGRRCFLRVLKICATFYFIYGIR